MKNLLWKFIDNKGSFVSETAHKINTLYFPLCNHYPFMSCISPDLHGDIKTDNDSFLLEPVSRIDLSNSKVSRNFWIYINPQKIWSVTGVSKNTDIIKYDKFKLEAGLLWHRIIRQNKLIGLMAKITSFVPASGDPLEIMLVEITNVTSRPIKFIPTIAIPIYARSANNLRDHRHVSSLLNRIEKHRFGVMVKPTLLFNEAGHRKNFTIYFVLATDQNRLWPEYIYPTQEEFTGEISDLEAPEVVFNNLRPDRNSPIQGREAMAGLRFKKNSLKPQETYAYIILMGIVKDEEQIVRLFNRFNTVDKVKNYLEETARYWQKETSQISLDTADRKFDNWFRWVKIQPILRRIFGCSFLPDFDYGKGGRGWRDLWQDCLYLTLTEPKKIKESIIDNFAGVRIDGSNATIIGQKPGEFISDRNNINRVWMDHGIWPLLCVHLYIHQTADIKILLKKTTYFKDHQLNRSQLIDTNWKPTDTKKLKTKDGKIYKGTLLEHILVENLVQFFNVGPHNHIRLENADWNDGLDMAAEFGESVTFSALYAYNLKTIAELLEKLKQPNIVVFKELIILLDSLSKNPISYKDRLAKRKILENYFQTTQHGLSGKKVTLPTHKVKADLIKKANWISEHIRKTEWLKEGFFNGYYNNDKKRVEGKIGGILRMTLTGQTFPIMSGIATEEQTKVIFNNVKHYLKDSRLGGFRLNTDFKHEQLNLGRAFSFVYGDKENGAFFNHMAVMFAYALYKRGFAREGYEVIESIYNMAVNTKQSKIYPCIPEYFNSEGRGMYSYLTGSASWLVLLILTQMFGVRGNYGDFVIEPKLIAAQFRNRNNLSIATSFADRNIEVKFINPFKKDFGRYLIQRVSFNRKTIAENIKQTYFLVPRKKFLTITNTQNNLIEVLLD
ncbi:MAG: cellobiose phosphorylase [Candidatus Omnitrophica bacterium]|nr:cellobiose phosphorylase [Candidatus Omnitrophota bacterium]